MQSTTVVVCILLKLILQERRPFVCMLSFLFVRTLSGRVVDLYVDTFGEVDAQYQNAIQNGAASLLEPTTEPWRQRTCFIADPEGNIIEIGSWKKPYENDKEA